MKYTRYIAVAIMIYVIVFVCWWIVLLTRLESENFDLKQQLLQHNSSEQIESVQSDYDQSIRMIYYEGGVFLVLLILSSVYVTRSIKRQEKFNQVQTNFLLATTHEFKTPLATTKLNLQTLQSKQLNQEQKDKLINNSISELNRLNDLVDNILLTAKLEATNSPLVLEPVLLSPVIQSVLKNYPKRRFKVQGPDDLSVIGDRQSLLICINNLVDNAVKYSSADSPISILTKQKSNKVELSIIDEGIGIPEVETQAIFNRFYRIGNEASRTTKGTGLGLYIVKQLIGLMGGSIQVSANHPKGSIFVMQLNVAND